MLLRDVEFFNVFTDKGANDVRNRWHIRRPGPEQQPTLCGLLFGAEGEKERGAHVLANACPECLQQLEVTDGSL